MGEIEAVDMPFLLVYADDFSNDSRYSFYGILGLAPKDDSSGPLLIDHLYEQGAIDEPYFAVLQAPSV